MMENTEITKIYNEAVELHSKIMANAELAAGALLEMCQGLKEMRDKELYKALQMETFDEYCESKVGIKARQAYTYISTYERLGSSVLQSNAKLGITKLELIAQLPAIERTEGLNNGQFEGMSAKELKELVKRERSQAEQMDLLKQENERLTDAHNDTLEDLQQVLHEKQKLECRIRELESRPTEVAVQEPSKEDIERLTNQIRAELESATQQGEEDQITPEKLQMEIDQAVARTKKEAKEEYKQKQEKIKQQQKKAAQEIEQAKQRIEVLSKQLALANPEKTMAAIHFKAMQDNYNKMLQAIEKMQDNDKVNFKSAVKKALITLVENLQKT